MVQSWISKRWKNKADEIDSQVSNAIEEIQEGYRAKAASTLEIKLLPAINSQSISKIDKDVEYKVTEIINKWSYIESEDKAGWILTSKLEGSIIKTEENLENNQNNTEIAKEEISNEEKTTEIEEKQEEPKKEEQKKEETKQENTTVSDTKTETKYVSAETLNIREQAKSDAKVIGQLDLNTKITVLEVIDNTWSKIESKGITGYVASKYLSNTKTEITSRSGDTARESQEVENTQTEKNQEKIAETENATTSAKEQKSTQSENTNTKTTSISGASVVEYAKQYLGCKYVLGGTSPSGFDCSGFTTYVFKHFGISLSRTSGAQASNGTKVERSNLQAGDILIFNDSSNSKVGHVGIYIGGNQFIHAANPSKGVIITSLSESYYSTRYVGARRVI